MGRIIRISDSEITEALRGTTRQYLAGNLARPQLLEFIRDERLEIGISDYPEYYSEPAHRHSIATEYQYMISGWTEYMDTETNGIYEFRAGDFYAILPGTSYAQRIKAGTRILFIKVPSVNDKELADITEEQGKWLRERMKTVRTDYYHQADAPQANSMRPAAAVAILNDRREMLMLLRKDNQKWTMPGGTMEYNESLTDCALREVREESGLEVVIKDLIGTYTDPEIRIAYSDGEVRREFTVVYYGEALNSEVILDDESGGYRWVPMDQVPELPLAGSQRRRVLDVIEYLKNGTKRLG